MFKLFKPKSKAEERPSSVPYDSPDDIELRRFCLALVMSHPAYKKTVDSGLCDAAEELRNYLRYGIPYAPHWTQDKKKS